MVLYLEVNAGLTKVQLDVNSWEKGVYLVSNNASHTKLILN
jgi:hypothetical protein